MNKDFCLALLRDVDTNGPEEVIDFTRYDLPAKEPQVPQREWSLMNVINQKGTREQDKPRPLQQLSSEDQRLIFHRYPDLVKLALNNRTDSDRSSLSHRVIDAMASLRMDTDHRSTNSRKREIG